MDASLIVVQITAANDEAAAALKDPRNAEFLVPRGDTPEPPSLEFGRRDSTPFVETSSINTVLRLDHYPFDPVLGWVFGREGEDVDYVLGSRDQGVSQKHFRIDHNWKAMTLVLTNMSGNWTEWTDTETGEVEKLTGSRAIVGQMPYRIGAGTVRLMLQIPMRTPEQQARYDVRIKQLRDEVALATPAMQGLTVAPLREEPTPRVAGQFILGRVIGTGTTAIVREAFDRVTGDRFAAKEYTLTGQSTLNSMLREIKLLQKLKHNHIIGYVDVYKNPDPVLIMEYGLKSLEECTITTTSECVNLLRQVLSGLAFIHDKQTMHRDLKPSNILLTHDFPRAEWKLGDFGLSKETDMTGTFCGTLLYLAPEIDGLVGSVYTNAVDVWSVGVVGLQYSCGFNPRDLRKVRTRQDHKVWTEAVARRAKSKISVLSEILTEMLDIIPTGRPTASDVLKRLEGLSDTEGSGPGEGDYTHLYENKNESKAKAFKDGTEDESNATTIRAAEDGDREETRENVSNKVTPVSVKTGLQRGVRKRPRTSPD